MYENNFKFQIKRVRYYKTIITKSQDSMQESTKYLTKYETLF